MINAELIELLREARELIKTGWHGRDCDEVESVVGRINTALSQLIRNHSDVRVLRSNCEHSNDGQFRVHLTEADFLSITGEIERLQTLLALRKPSDKGALTKTDIVDPPPKVDPSEVWVLRFCDMVGIDGSSELGRLETLAKLNDLQREYRKWSEESRKR